MELRPADRLPDLPGAWPDASTVRA